VKPGESTALENMTQQELDEINEQISIKAENPYHTIRISKATVIKVSSIRDIIREGAYRSPGHGRTVVILFEADKMNHNAANALLKSLEEPTGDLMFILTTSNRNALLPTILSRCQQLQFEPLSAQEIATNLRRENLCPEELISIVSQLSAGSYSKARSMATDDYQVDREIVLNYLRLIVMNKPVELLALLQGLANPEERRSLLVFLSLVQFWFRDVMAIRAGVRESVVNVDLLEPMEKFSDHYPYADCGLAVKLIEKTIEMIPKNVHLTNALVVLTLNLRKAIVTQNIETHL
jgi:DNA polymerase-3 subunit delta'